MHAIPVDSIAFIEERIQSLSGYAIAPHSHGSEVCVPHVVGCPDTLYLRQHPGGLRCEPCEVPRCDECDHLSGACRRCADGRVLLGGQCMLVRRGDDFEYGSEYNEDEEDSQSGNSTDSQQRDSEASIDVAHEMLDLTVGALSVMGVVFAVGIGCGYGCGRRKRLPFQRSGDEIRASHMIE